MFNEIQHLWYKLTCEKEFKLIEDFIRPRRPSSERDRLIFKSKEFPVRVKLLAINTREGIAGITGLMLGTVTSGYMVESSTILAQILIAMSGIAFGMNFILDEYMRRVIDSEN